MISLIKDFLIVIGASIIFVSIIISAAYLTKSYSIESKQPDTVRINSGDHTLEPYMKYMCEKECKCPSR